MGHLIHQWLLRSSVVGHLVVVWICGRAISGSTDQRNLENQILLLSMPQLSQNPQALGG